MLKTRICVAIVLISAIVYLYPRTVHADVLPVTATVKLRAEGDAITASLNQDMVKKIDQENRSGGIVIKAPVIEFRCKGGIATTCSDRVMDGVEVKIRKIQNLVVNCQRGVESVSSLNLSSQVRAIVDTMPANIKLFVASASSDKGTRRSQRRSIDGFCELSPADLSRTPTL